MEFDTLILHVSVTSDLLSISNNTTEAERHPETEYFVLHNKRMIPAWTPNNKYILKLRNVPG